MSALRILVYGATGKTGGAVVKQLRERGVDVRALVRKRDERGESLERLGAELVVGDAFDPLAIAHALHGVRRVYYCPPWHPHMLQTAVTLATAARKEGIEVIVALSQWLASPQHRSLASQQSWLVEQLFEMVPGAAHITLNPGFFADNYLTLIGFAAQLGLFPMPMGKGRNAPPSNDDIARVAVAALLNPEKHASKTYRPTGPTLLSATEMAGILSDVLGRKVRHVEMPMWMFLKALRVLGPRFGVDAFQQSGLRHYIAEHRLGTFEQGAPTDHVEKVSGAPAEDFATIARRYARRPDAQRTVGNFARAVLDFMRIGVVPALNLDRFVRMQQHPQLAAATLAKDSAEWAREHGLLGRPQS